MTEKILDKYMAVKAFHDYAEEYDSWFEDSPVYEIEMTALKSLHAEMDEPKFEIGVGPGRFASGLDIAFGIDPAWAPLTLASQREIKCCQALGEQLPVKDRIMGTIFVLFTLCFAADPQRIIWECSRVLKEGGLLVIGMIPSGSAWGRSLVSKKKAGHFLYRYATFYTIDTLKKWLTNANMSITEYNSSLYQVPGCVKQIEAPRKLLDEKAGFVIIVARKGQ
ncbi:class I SAM-dependent methyltransferase [Thermodesulfobacteriota bacterium]